MYRGSCILQFQLVLLSFSSPISQVILAKYFMMVYTVSLQCKVTICCDRFSHVWSNDVCSCSSFSRGRLNKPSSCTTTVQYAVHTTPSSHCVGWAAHQAPHWSVSLAAYHMLSSGVFLYCCIVQLGHPGILLPGSRQIKLCVFYQTSSPFHLFLLMWRNVEYYQYRGCGCPLALPHWMFHTASCHIVHGVPSSSLCTQ